MFIYKYVLNACAAGAKLNSIRNILEYNISSIILTSVQNVLHLLRFNEDSRRFLSNVAYMYVMSCHVTCDIIIIYPHPTTQNQLTHLANTHSPTHPLLFGIVEYLSSE